MVEGRGEFEWAMTANLMAIQINLNRKKGTKAVDPTTLNPFRQKEKPPKIMLFKAESMDMLKKAFVRK